MTNNDIFKKLRVALMLRDDQIVEILELVDFRISKTELSAFFRTDNHENYVECGDQVLRNFLNGLVIYLRGTKENPKKPNVVLSKNKAEITAKDKTVEKPNPNKPRFESVKQDKANTKKPEQESQTTSKTKFDAKKKPFKKKAPKLQVVEKVKYNFGKNKK
jgi:Protein of unknown function (DUF1456)